MKSFSASAASVLSSLLITAAAFGQTAAVTVVHTFTGPDGNAPSSVIQASDGNLWGTAARGGQANDGTIFKIFPDGTLLTVFDFADGNGTTDGFWPASLIEGNDGNFYGLTSSGGNGQVPYVGTGFGTFFRLTPQGQLTTLFDIGQGSGANPNPGLVEGTDGNFYATNEYGVTVFSPVGSLLDYSEIYTDPSIMSGLLQHTNGTFYGASSFGDKIFTYTLANGLSQYSFGPLGLGEALAEGTDGEIYGAGTNMAFRFTTSGTHQKFQTSDFNSISGAVAASDGNVYGVANTSGGNGTLFDVTTSGVFNQLDTTNPPTSAANLLFAPTLVQAADGSFLLPIAEYFATTNSLYRYTVTPALPAPIQLSTSESSIALGASFTLQWKVLNATSATLRQCDAFLSRAGTGGGNWSGLQTGTFSGGIYSGSATITPTTGGSYTYALTCGGTESGYATVSVTGGSSSTTITQLHTFQANIKAPASASLTAIVTSTTGGYVPTGTVTFNDGSLRIASVPLSNGFATLTASTATIPAGTYNITAHYSGDANDTASTSSPVTIVVQGVSATTLVISPPTFTVGGSTTMTATVLAVHGGPVPTGTVQFVTMLDGDQTSFGSATLNSAGVATLVTPTSPQFPAGTYAVTAEYYVGDTYNQPSTSAPVTLYITTPTTTALSIYPSSVTNGHYVTFTATVAATGNNTVTAGTVAFSYGSLTVATGTVNSSGVASANVLVQNIPVGTYPITAKYQGTTVYSPSTSTPANVTVTQ